MIAEELSELLKLTIEVILIKSGIRHTLDFGQTFQAQNHCIEDNNKR